MMRITMKLLRLGYFIISLILCLITTSCAHRSILIGSTLPASKQAEMSHEAMIAAASSINTSLLQLEKIERYRKPRIISVREENMSRYNLGQRVLVDWSGPIEPLINEVAVYSDYKLKVVGVAPAIPVLIDIANDNIAIGDIIRQAHLQAKERVNLVIYPKSKTIELRYNELG